MSNRNRGAESQWRGMSSQDRAQPHSTKWKVPVTKASKGGGLKTILIVLALILLGTGLYETSHCQPNVRCTDN